MMQAVETRNHLFHVREALRTIRQARGHLELAAAEARLAAGDTASAPCAVMINEALELERLRGGLELVARRLTGPGAGR